MYSKITFCAALLIQLYMVNSQSCGSQSSCCEGCGVTFPLRGFQVQSISPISPTGLFVISENQLDGTLNVEGKMPFLGAVALQGELPNNGNADVCYCCGDGQVGITQENSAPCGGLGSWGAF